MWARRQTYPASGSLGAPSLVTHAKAHTRATHAATGSLGARVPRGLRPDISSAAARTNGISRVRSANTGWVGPHSLCFERQSHSVPPPRAQRRRLLDTAAASLGLSFDGGNAVACCRQRDPRCGTRSSLTGTKRGPSLDSEAWSLTDCEKRERGRPASRCHCGLRDVIVLWSLRRCLSFLDWLEGSLWMKWKRISIGGVFCNDRVSSPSFSPCAEH